MVNITTEHLVAAGYHKFCDNMAANSLKDWYRASYQKRVVDDTGTRYFINIVHGVAPAIGDIPARDFFTPSNQFNKDGTTFNVEMLVHDESLEQVEAFFDNLWITMKLDYYEQKE